MHIASIKLSFSFELSRSGRCQTPQKLIEVYKKKVNDEIFEA